MLHAARSTRSLNGNQSQRGDLTDPSCRSLIAGRHDAKRAFFSVERLTVALVCEDDFACGECRIKLSQGKDDFVAVGGFHQNSLGHAWSTHRVAELNACHRKQSR